MIDHEYKISLREVSTTLLNAQRFVAELSQIYLLVNGERLRANYPKKHFFGDTQTAAMLQASEALRIWLKAQGAAPVVKLENCEV